MNQDKRRILLKKEDANPSLQLARAYDELAYQKEDKRQRDAELILANRELAFQKDEKAKRAAELVLANIELDFQNTEKQKRATEALVLHQELAFQKHEKGKRAAELSEANKELVYQTEEKGKRATELILANIALAIENEKTERTAAELKLANIELIFQNEEKEKRAARLVVANRELAFENEEKEKRAAELIIANTELAFQNTEKEKLAAELIIANKELAFQNVEKEKRANELIVANKELLFQNAQKEKRAAELIIANKELVFQSEEKGKRATELIVANIELAFQNEEKGKRASELIAVNAELAFQNVEKEKRAAELIYANRELVKAEEQFRLVVEFAPNAMVLINALGIITLVNTETEKLFLQDRAEIVGNPLTMLIPERFHACDPHHESILFRASSTDVSGLRDVFARRKNGTEIAVEVELNSLETSKGKMVLASIVDITDRRIQEAVLKEHNNELGQIVYVASHDLQEPLRTVSNYMQLFQEEYHQCLDSNALRYINSINTAIKRMLSLINSLLDFSKLGYNRNLELVDCGKVVDGVMADLSTIIESSGAIIEVDQLPRLYAYEMEIRQLFQNLITNAIKFCKTDASPRIHISAQQVNDKYKFSVRDHGIGIDPAYSTKVFEIFQRLHTKQEYQGSGIGLANCKKIVQLHLGDIWVESKEGEGSIFHFTIANLIV
jgi:PAS domain S-box-containing protein